MDVNYINPLLEATTSVLTTMAKVEIEPGRVAVRKSSDTLADVTGVIDLKGKEIDGWLAVGFYEGTILKIAHNMLQNAFEKIDPMVVDLVGELTNMISGSARSIYSQKGLLDIDMALPQVVVGQNKALNRQVHGGSIMLPFSSDVGEFCVEFSLAN